MLLIWLSLAIVFFIPSLSDLGEGDVKPHSLSISYYLTYEYLIAAHIYAFFIMLTYSLIMFVLFRNVYKGFDLNLTMKKEAGDRFFITLVLGISLVSLFSYINRLGLNNVMAMGFLDFRESIPFHIRIGLIYTQVFVGAIALYYYFNKKIMYCCLVLSYLTFLFIFIGGSRQPIVVTFLAGFFYLAQHKQKISYYYLLITFSIPAIYLMQLLLSLRNINGFEAKINFILSGQFIEALHEASDESNLRYVYYYFVNNFSDIEGFAQFDYLARTLLAWLPSAFSFGMKPIDFEVTMFKVFMPGYNGTMHPLLFGSIVSDSGFFFIPWLLLIASVVLLSSIFSRDLTGLVKFLFVTVLCLYAVMLARGAIYGVTVMVLFTGLFIFFVRNIIPK